MAAPRRSALPLATEGTQEKLKYIWFFTRFALPLATPKVLSLGKLQIHLHFRSVCTTFGYAEGTLARQ